MIDPVWVGVGVAVAAAGAGVIGLYIQHRQLRALVAQVKLTSDQLVTEQAKVTALGDLVGALKGGVEAQRGLLEVQGREIDTLRSAVSELAKGNAIREAQLEIQRQDASVRAALLTVSQQDAAVRAAQLRWDQTSPLDKAALFAGEVVDRARDGLRRLFGRRRSF